MSLFLRLYKLSNLNSVTICLEFYLRSVSKLYKIKIKRKDLLTMDKSRNINDF